MIRKTAVLFGQPFYLLSYLLHRYGFYLKFNAERQFKQLNHKEIVIYFIYNNLGEFNKMVKMFGFRLAYSIILVGMFIGGIMLLETDPTLRYPHFLIWVSSFLIFAMIVKWIFRRK